MSAITSALAAVRRSDPVPDLPAGKRWSTSRDPESALLTLADQARDSADDFLLDAYGTRVLPIQRGQR
jgi:hypothetical protein